LKRREFVTLLGGAAAAWPLAAHGQPTRVARIGYVSGTGNAADPGPFVEALQQGMREHGYVDGKDFIVEYRGAEGKQARVPELVAELVQAKSSSHLFRLQSARPNRRPIRFRLLW
jgi:putative ABC transport system substrate-binding protein